eukprot:GFUD01082443.1.p1 GENE.GFUD01082443.1~~GFUD01082443.1.p1  ORF type:complete len:355 (-),score=94.32 GFUD01082443.1:11-1075(-)
MVMLLGLLFLLLDMSNTSKMRNMTSLDTFSSQVACTDHSDCTSLGHMYRCLLYRCADYTDTRLVLCSGEEECGDEQQCYMNHLLPLPSGLCLPYSSLHPCSFQADCHAFHGHPHCCGGWCCPTSYFRQLRNFSCSTNLQCRVWKTGQFCCPDSRCCHSLPDYNAYYADYSALRYEDTYAYTVEEEYYYQYTAPAKEGTASDEDQNIIEGFVEEEANRKTEEAKVTKEEKELVRKHFDYNEQTEGGQKLTEKDDNQSMNMVPIDHLNDKKSIKTKVKSLKYFVSDITLLIEAGGSKDMNNTKDTDEGEGETGDSKDSKSDSRNWLASGAENSVLTGGLYSFGFIFMTYFRRITKI